MPKPSTVDLGAVITPGAIDWHGDSDPRTYGLLTATMFGGSFHMEFIEVSRYETANGRYAIAPVDNTHDEKLEALQSALSGDYFQTVEIEGRHYVVVMSPFDM